MGIDADGDRPNSETVYLELTDSQSRKFYEVTVNEIEVTIRYGRIGTSGQSSSTTYATAEKAQAEARKKINEKLRKGYVQVSSEGDEPTVVEQPSPASGSVSPVGEVRSHTFDLARLRLGIYQDRIFLGVPLQGVLVAVELTAICKQPTFTINLDTDSDIAYHFDARALQRQIVQNTCVAGVWGSGGEILAIPPEFASSQPFTLRIAVEQTLVVYLSDRILSRYTHRLPPAQIKAVHIVYPPENLHVQSVLVLEQTDIGIEMLQSDRTILPAQAEPPSHPSPAASHPIAQTTTPTKTTDLPPFLRDLPPQFEPLRSFLQQNLVPYVKIQAGEQVGDMDSDRGTGDPLTVWQSKMGGNPYFPKNAEYPLDPGTGKAMPLLMQINCADVPPIAGSDFPQQGMLQFYLGGGEPADAHFTPGRYRVFYFAEISTDESNLMTDFSFIEDRETIRGYTLKCIQSAL